MSVDREKFEAASKAAESWLNTAALIGHLGELGSADQAFTLLSGLARGYTGIEYGGLGYAHVLCEEFEALATLSDGKESFEGYRRIVADPTGVYPLVTSSAHEAAHGIARLALELLVWPLNEINDPVERRTLAKQLLANRWKALVMPIEEVAALRERIRRERAKLLSADLRPAEWSRYLPPQKWRKLLSEISHTTLQRMAKPGGPLIVQKFTARQWSIRMDCLVGLLSAADLEGVKPLDASAK